MSNQGLPSSRQFHAALIQNVKLVGYPALEKLSFGILAAAYDSHATKDGSSVYCKAVRKWMFSHHSATTGRVAEWLRAKAPPVRVQSNVSLNFQVSKFPLPYLLTRG